MTCFFVVETARVRCSLTLASVQPSMKLGGAGSGCVTVIKRALSTSSARLALHGGLPHPRMSAQPAESGWVPNWGSAGDTQEKGDSK